MAFRVRLERTRLRSALSYIKCVGLAHTQQPLLIRKTKLYLQLHAFSGVISALADLMTSGTGDGECSVALFPFDSRIKEGTGAVELEYSGGELKVDGAAYPTIPPADRVLPRLRWRTSEPSEVLCDMLSEVVAACKKRIPYGVPQIVLFNDRRRGACAVATDDRRLHLSTREGSRWPWGAISIPVEAANAILFAAKRDIGYPHVCVDRTNSWMRVSFRFHEVVVRELPEYRIGPDDVDFDEYDLGFFVDAVMLLDGLRRFKGEDRIEFHFTSRELLLRCGEQAYLMEVDGKGKKAVILDRRAVVDAVKAGGAETLLFGLYHDSEAVMIRRPGKSFQAVIVGRDHVDRERGSRAACSGHGRTTGSASDGQEDHGAREQDGSARA